VGRAVPSKPNYPLANVSSKEDDDIFSHLADDGRLPADYFRMRKNNLPDMTTGSNEHPKRAEEAALTVRHITSLSISNTLTNLSDFRP
jgi:hypothetical protein